MGLFKRGKVWWMDFTSSGKRIRRSLETEDRRIAERIYAKVVTEIVEGRYFERIPGEMITFSEMMERYIEEITPKKVCPEKEILRVNRHLIPFFGSYFLSQITPKLINAYKQKRYSQGVKPDTINRELSIMRHAFTVAVKEWEWLKESPFKKVSEEKGKVKRERWLSFEEEERLLSSSPDWLRDFITFAAWTGMRLGNIISLKWDQVDMHKRLIYIGGTGQRRTKNREPVVIPMNQKVFELLKRRARVRRIDTDLVFTSPTGRPLEPSNLRRSFREVLRKAGIKDLRIHDLRHTYGTRLAQAGVDLFTISRLLGHKDIRTTQRYAHHSTLSLRLAIERFEREFGTNLTQFGDKALDGQEVYP